MVEQGLKKVISVITLIGFIFTNSAYGAQDSRSFFKNKRVDYEKLSTQNEERLRQKKAIFEEGDERAQEHKREAQRILSSHLDDLSQIHIPSEIGRITEVHKSISAEEHKDKLIVHIQDLHTNPEAELNLAKILETLLKDYNLGLVCSEGADGIVDTSSVSSFPDYRAREKVAKIFVDSGELTGEEYLSITKYPDLQIWGIEDRDIYFKNIIEFNKIIKFSPSSQVFISQTKKALEDLKPKVYSKELLNLDQKEADYDNKKIETDEYLKYLTSYITKFNIPTEKYRNVTLLKEAIDQESQIDQLKVMQDSQNLLLNLRAELAENNLRSDLDSLMVQAQLFKEQKISPFSFYSYLKDLALQHIPDQISKYENLNDFIDYLTKVNSLDSTKLFNEMTDLTFEAKMKLSKNDKEKTITKALRNINFLEGFFNLKVSNEELDYYLENRDSHKVGWFKTAITDLTGSTGQTNFIDYNPALIDAHLQELEDFYKTVKDRDIAMVNNSLSEIEKRDVKVSALISGGFHTKGITKLLREKGYSYIVVSPYSKTDIDEENYHFLLTGMRKPIEELMKQLDLPKIVDRFLNSLRVGLAFDTDLWDGIIRHILPALQNYDILTPEEADEIAGQDLTGRFNFVLSLASGKITPSIAIRRIPTERLVVVRRRTRENTPYYYKLAADGSIRHADAHDFELAEALTLETADQPQAPATETPAQGPTLASGETIEEAIETLAPILEEVLRNGGKVTLSRTGGLLHEGVSPYPELDTNREFLIATVQLGEAMQNVGIKEIVIKGPIDADAIERSIRDHFQGRALASNEDISATLQEAIKGDKNSYSAIKSMPSAEIIAYFETDIRNRIARLPEALFGYGFGYDIRGNALSIEGGEVDITPENFYAIGKLLALKYAKPQDKGLVTGDMRVHTPMLRYAMALGAASVGVEMDFSEDALHTGAHNVYSAENPKGYKFQIQISGSHGVYQKNGAKIKADLVNGVLDPVYGEDLLALYNGRLELLARSRQRSNKSITMNEAFGIEDAVASMYDQTLPPTEGEEILIIDARAGGAGDVTAKLFRMRGYIIVDVDEILGIKGQPEADMESLLKERANVDKILAKMYELWEKGNHKILFMLNMHPDPYMRRGIWDPSKPEALVASTILVKAINSNLREDMPECIGGVYDGDGDRVGAIKEDGEAVQAFEMTMPYYQRFLLNEKNMAAIIAMVKAGGEPLWLACDVRANSRLQRTIERLNDLIKDKGRLTQDPLKAVYISTGYPPQLSFIAWRIAEMKKFIDGKPELKNDPVFMENFRNLIHTYYTAEASGHNFFHASPGNPERPCDCALSALVSLVNIKETMGDVEVPELEMQQRDRYTLTELFASFPGAFTSNEIRVVIPNAVKIETAHNLGRWLQDQYGPQLLDNPDTEAVNFSNMIIQPINAGLVTVAGYKAQLKNGDSALIRWSNTGEQLTLLFEGHDMDSLVTIVETTFNRMTEEQAKVPGLKLGDLEKELGRLREARNQGTKLASNQAFMYEDEDMMPVPAVLRLASGETTRDRTLGSNNELTAEDIARMVSGIAVPAAKVIGKTDEFRTWAGEPNQRNRIITIVAMNDKEFKTVDELHGYDNRVYVINVERADRELREMFMEDFIVFEENPFGSFDFYSIGNRVDNYNKKLEEARASGV